MFYRSLTLSIRLIHKKLARPLSMLHWTPLTFPTMVHGKKSQAGVSSMLCLRNNIKNAQPPCHSLGRGTQNRIIDKIMNKVAHRKNGQEDPWLNKTWIAEANWKKQPSYVEYRHGFVEQDARLLRSMNSRLTEDCLSDASTPPSSSVSKNQKVIELFETSTRQHARLQEQYLQSTDNFVATRRIP
jgi:hypothetical protein